MLPVVAMTVLWWIFAVCLVMGFTAWLIFTWSIKTGQFDDVEQTARDLLEQDRQQSVPASELRTRERSAP